MLPIGKEATFPERSLKTTASPLLFTFGLLLVVMT